MVKITLGTSSSLLSGSTDPTAEAYFMDLLVACQAVEADQAKNPQSYNFFQSTETQDPPTVITALANIPVERDLDAQGRGLFYAKADLYTNTGYSPGTGGTFKASFLAQAFIEVLMTLEELQDDATKNLLGVSYVQWNLRKQGNDFLFVGQATIPIKIDRLPEGGKISRAIEWLQGSL